MLRNYETILLHFVIIVVNIKPVPIECHCQQSSSCKCRLLLFVLEVCNLHNSEFLTPFFVPSSFLSCECTQGGTNKQGTIKLQRTDGCVKLTANSNGTTERGKTVLPFSAIWPRTHDRTQRKGMGTTRRWAPMLRALLYSLLLNGVQT